MTNYRIERASDPDALARQASDTVAAQISLVLDQRDRCRIALSGGSTPGATWSSHKPLSQQLLRLPLRLLRFFESTASVTCRITLLCLPMSAVWDWLIMW